VAKYSLKNKNYRSKTMSEAPKILIYGASGYTGKLVAECLAQRNLPFYFVGRNQQKLEDALAIVAQMVGTLQLARAVADPMLSVRILKAGRQAVDYLIPPELAEGGGT